MKQVVVMLALIASLVYMVDGARSFMTAAVVLHNAKMEAAVSDEYR